MNPPAVARSWSRQRWCSVIALFFLLQVGLIWWFSPRAPLSVDSATGLPRVLMQVTSPQSGPGQVNPLFLSHVTREGFSGPVWLESPPLPQPALEWTNPPAGWLNLGGDTLGLSLAELLQQVVPLTPHPIHLPEVDPELAVSLPPPPLIQQPSRLRIEGELAARAPRHMPTLKDWESESLLKPTVLEVVVDATGRVISMVPAVRSEFIPTPASRAPLALSGLPEADRFAEQTALALQFQPDPSASPPGTISGPLTRGRLIFEWRTLPPAPTNAAVQLP